MPLASHTVKAGAAHGDVAGGVRGRQGVGAAGAGGLLDQVVAAGRDAAGQRRDRRGRVPAAERYWTDQPLTLIAAQVGL